MSKKFIFKQIEKVNKYNVSKSYSSFAEFHFKLLFLYDVPLHHFDHMITYAYDKLMKNSAPTQKHLYIMYFLLVFHNH